MNLFFTELDSYIYMSILHCRWLVYSMLVVCFLGPKVCLLEWGIAFKF